MGSASRLLILALEWILRWSGRTMVSCLFVGVLLAPAALFYLMRTDVVEPTNLTPLDPLPWRGLLWLAFVVTYALLLLAFSFALGFVWQRSLTVVRVLAMLLAVPFSLAGIVASESIVKRLVSREIQSTSLHPILILAKYTTTIRVKTSVTTERWVDLSHPLEYGKRLKLPEHLLTSDLSALGTFACLEVRTSLFGMRWITPPHVCPFSPSSNEPLPSLGMVLLQPELRGIGPGRLYGTHRPEGFFDDAGKAWFLGRFGIAPKVVMAERDADSSGSGRCGLIGDSRLSTDQRSISSFFNLSTVGALLPGPMLPWERLTHNVWVWVLDSDGSCTTRGAILHPGWVLESDFDSKSGRLAVLSLRRTGATGKQPRAEARIEYWVSVYKVDSDGNSRIVKEQIVRQQAEQTFAPPQDPRLRWMGGGLAARLDGDLKPLWVIAPTSESSATGTSGAAPRTLPPQLAGLLPSGWRLATEAKAAPVSLYLNDHFGGALLLHRQQGVWYYLSPFAQPHSQVDSLANSDEQRPTFSFDFRDVRASLSPDGHRLMACGGRTPSDVVDDRCKLLSLPWAD